MKYIFVDVDGTIIDHKSHSVPESTINCLKQLMKDGHKVFISSGRAYIITNTGTGIDFDGYICSLGANVIYNGEELIDNPFSEELLNKIIEEGKKYQIELSFEGKKKGYCASRLYDRVYVNEDARKMYQGDVDYWVKADEAKEPTYKVMAEGGTKENFLKFNETIKDKVNFAIDNTKDYCSEEITLNTNSKGDAIVALSKILGFDMKDTICIGDSTNDIPMLKVCNDSIVMGQALDEVKKHATYVTDSVDNDGFYKAFKHLGLVD